LGALAREIPGLLAVICPGARFASNSVDHPPSTRAEFSERGGRRSSKLSFEEVISASNQALEFDIGVVAPYSIYVR